VLLRTRTFKKPRFFQKLLLKSAIVTTYLTWCNNNNKEAMMQHYKPVWVASFPGSGAKMVGGLVWMDNLSRRQDDVMGMLCCRLWWESKNTRLHACSANFWRESKIQ
jgi:hypothetical protein